MNRTCFLGPGEATNPATKAATLSLLSPQIVAPVLAPSGPLALQSLKESATAAKLMEGDLGAK